MRQRDAVSRTIGGCHGESKDTGGETEGVAGKAGFAIQTTERSQFCIDFALIPNKTVLGPSFTLSGFAFTQAAPELIVLAQAEKGLRFPSPGMNVKLPMVAATVTLRAGTFAGPFDVTAWDAAGAKVGMRTVNFGNAFGDESITSSADPIAALDFTGGGNEAMLVRLCISFECAAP